ncbi:MAG: hypothetical protein BWY69_00031 [Planctomycetes bacterium ADurb.Bin401]|nr:MAG: hypothetical protein BWY69_00031 [Planctomycetes bacterium ADurb.Bin401]
MANSSAIKAGAAYVEIFADKSPLMRGLRAAQADLKKWGSTISSFGRKIMAAGAAVITPLAGAAKYFSSCGDNIAKTARKTGFAVETLSALSFAAEQSGSNLETVEKSIRKMQSSILDAGMGLKTTTDIFDMLGLSAQSFSGLKPEEQFRLLADRISKIEDPSKRAAIAMKIFGRSGTALLPLFERGAAGIDELMKEAKELGLVMSGEDALAAEELNDAMNRVYSTMKMAFANLGAAIAPIITEISNKIAVVIGKTSNWIKENRHIVRMALWLGAALISAGGAFIVFGNAIKFAGSVFGTIHSSFALLKTALLWLMSPIGMIVTGVTAATAVFLYFTKYGGQLVQWLGSRFTQLQKDATDAIGGISAAFAKGDLGLAAKIGWLFVKMEWLKAKQWLLDIWNDFKMQILKIWYAAVYGITVGWDGAVYGVQISWIETVGLIQKLWIKAGSLLKTSWIVTVEAFKNIWIGFKQFWADTIDSIAKKLMNVWIWWKKLTDPNFDEEAARKQIDETFSQDKNERDSDFNDQRAKNAAEANKTIVQLENDTQDQLDSIEKNRSDKKKRAKEKFDSGVSGAQQYVEEGLQNTVDAANSDMAEIAEQIEQTKKDFNDAIARAKEPGPAKANPKTPTLKQDWQANGLDKASTFGTFSAFGLSQLGAGGVMQKIADATQRTAAATEEIADNTADGGMEFGD